MAAFFKCFPMIVSPVAAGSKEAKSSHPVPAEVMQKLALVRYHLPFKRRLQHLPTHQSALRNRPEIVFRKITESIICETLLHWRARRGGASSVNPAYPPDKGEEAVAARKFTKSLLRLQIIVSNDEYLHIVPSETDRKAAHHE